MAIKSAVRKAELEIVDMDKHYYETHRLTVALHPSETDERMMVRILAFALNAHERLEFGKGISEAGEPDLWLKDLTGTIELWIELGHPDARLLSKAAGRSARVVVYAYSARPERWLDPIRKELEGLRNLRILSVDAASAAALSLMAGKDMRLQCTIQDGDVWVRDDEGREVEVKISELL